MVVEINEPLNLRKQPFEIGIQRNFILVSKTFLRDLIDNCWNIKNTID